MQITLMRHGPPVLAPGRWLAPREMAQWITQYDQAVVHTSAVPADSIRAARNAAVICTSTLARARASALTLGHAAARVDALFCEAALPHALWRFPRLPPPVWAAIFRLAWLCGYARGADSLATVRLRAQAASARLVACAAEGPVLLVGHGVMNRLIARELRAAGWSTTTRHRSGYWHSARYQSP